MIQEKVYTVSTWQRECGIASWTSDQIEYARRADPSLVHRVIAVDPVRRIYNGDVEFDIRRDVKADYKRAAEQVNQNSNGVVSIEHEFGIFGGARGKWMGDYLLHFLANLEVPTMITCHTLLGESRDDPDSNERKQIFREIIPYVQKFIAISHTARRILTEQYGIHNDRIRVIYHGAHEFPETKEQARKKLEDTVPEIRGRILTGTFGLVRRVKGIEHNIRALPQIIDKHPELIYAVVGETHPGEMEDGRELYRESLQKEVEVLGLENHVLFINQFLPRTDLLRWMKAADLFMATYGDPHQISSGPTSYCVGLGTPVIATPFVYAKELLAEGRGILLPTLDPEFLPSVIAEKVKDFLNDREERTEEIIRSIKPFKRRETLMWPDVAQVYIEEARNLMHPVTKKYEPSDSLAMILHPDSHSLQPQYQ